MECLGCGAEVAPGRRWCEACDIAGTARAELASPPPSAGAADPPPVSPTPWAYPVTPPSAGQPFPPSTAYAPPGPPPRGRNRVGVGIGLAVTAWIVLVGVVALGAFLLLHHSKSTRVAAPTSDAPRNPPTTSIVPLGYSAFVDHADSFRIAVPTDWRRINPSSPGATQQFQRMIQANPQFAVVFGPNASSIISKHIKFFAIDLHLTGLSPNINITVVPAVGLRDADLPEGLTDIRKSYDRLGLTILRSASVRLAGHEALQLTVTTPRAPGAQTQVLLPEIQYFVAANDLLYTITCTGVSTEFHTITASFRTS
jgi:hypothetical protein